MAELTTILLLTAIAFAGGAVGAALGALPSFALTGVVVVVGEVTDLGVGAAGPGGALGTTGLTASVGYGAGFGPHVAFAGGVAAAAYAARHRRLDTGFGYHEAKNVTYSLGPAPDVLVVGGAFGAVGYLVFHLAGTLGLPFDPVAFSIVVTAFLHRIAFGYPLVGTAPEGRLDMSPFERGQRREPVADGGATGAGAGGSRTGEPSRPRRLLVEPWLPHQYRWSDVAVLGGVVGVFGAYLAWVSGSALLGFGLAAASLLFLSVGVERFPVTHHMALPAGLLVVALGDTAGTGTTAAAVRASVPLWQVVGGGAVMGVVAGLTGELCQRLLYAHADTHLDPPAASIVLTTLLIALLDIVGLVEQSLVPTLGL